MNGRRRVPTWPVWLLALPAAVSIWAGWVGLGGLTGFGEVQLLPGIWDELRINTAITLPIGMEAYSAYALRVWLSPIAPRRAREFARTSALTALVLGSLGQIAYHLMAAAGWESAPWPVTAVVACLPVGVLGMGAALAHLLTDDEEPTTQTRPQQPAQPGPVARPAGTLSAPYRTVTTPAMEVPPSPVPAPAPVAATPLVAEPPRAPLWTAPADRPTGRTPVREAYRPADRPTDHPATRLADRPADRATDRSGSETADRRANRPARPSGSGRRSGSRRPRSDERVLAQIRELADRNGGRVPSQYQVKQVLGVGSGRAARLLAELAATTGPAAEPASNGAPTASGKGGSV